ncbi:MAG TPA: response regulator [Cyanobacteria bacterium UBA9273]|nr:response regulator [Cyanobacteria bacterium UBA9273]
MDVKFSANRIPPSIGKPPRILAVDDNEDNLQLLACVLESCDYSFVTATDGEKTLSLAKDYQPDLILLDIALPKIDGIEIVHRLKQDTLTHQIPVIAVTALARLEERDRILQAGCDDYISKPYLIDELINLIRRHLEEIPSPVLAGSS